MKAKIVLAAAVVLVLLVASSAAAKSQYGMRLGDSIAAQGEISPILFAGEPCVDVVEQVRGDGSEHSEVGITEIEAGREYWQMVLFADVGRTELVRAKPALILRDVDTGEEVRVTTSHAEGNEIGAYTTLSFEFPHAGSWTAALEDGSGNTFNYADGTVTATASDPMGDPLTEAEIDALDAPANECTSEEASTAGAGGSAAVLAVAIGIAAAALAVLGLRLRSRRTA